MKLKFKVQPIRPKPLRPWWIALPVRGRHYRIDLERAAWGEISFAGARDEIKGTTTSIFGCPVLAIRL